MKDYHVCLTAYKIRLRTFAASRFIIIMTNIESPAVQHLAHRLDRIQEPQTIRMAKLSRELKAQGKNIIDLSLGEPDFRTPDHIIEAATKAMWDGFTKYPPVAGFPELRQAVCDKLKRDNNLEYLPENVVVSTGAKQSLANVILSVINPGDEVIIPTPYWVTYGALVSLSEGKNVFVNCGLEDGFKITAKKLEAAITPRTRMFIFSSPCNPTGAVYTRDELASLVAVFEQYPDIVVLSDEIYEYINYTGGHQSIAQFDSIKDRVVIVNGFSKGFAMTGWRLGYIAAPKYIAVACEKFQAQFTSGANSISQRAAITALSSDLGPSMKMKEAFEERRNFVIDALQQMPGVKIEAPAGAFYAFPDISAFFGTSHGDTVIETDEDLSMYLLHHAGITTVNGAAFGSDKCIRLSFAASIDVLKEGMTRMKEALAALS